MEVVDMGKKVFVLFIGLLFLLVSFSFLYAGGKKAEEESVPTEEMEEAPAKKMVKNPDTIIYVRYGTIQTLDPHRAYDTSSGEAAQNMYDTLIAFDGPSTESFVPLVAERVPTVDNGLIRDMGRTYVFPIKRNVRFHNGDELTPEDVEYSFERALVTDQDGGPIWMFYEPLFGTAGSRDGDGNIVVNINDIMDAVEVDGQNVIFHLEDPYPPFIGILAQYWSGIINKDFMIAGGAWDGKKAGWERFNNPDQGAETLYNSEMGTGPYKLMKWEPGVELSMVRNDDYFLGPGGQRES
jgi:peptide/nickel transport system substrate-binding protein